MKIRNRMLRASVQCGLIFPLIFALTGHTHAQTVSFKARADLAADSPRSVAVADFNGDGKLDLAVTNPGSNNVSILLGNGDGSFQTALSFVAGNNPVSVAVGDFNGDGKLDLAVANYGSNNVSILLGNGDGTFQTAMNLNLGAGFNPLSVAVGDFNGDGKLDLAAAIVGYSDGYNYSVSVLLGNGDGTFQASRNLGAGHTANSVAVGDFNGDGNLDVVVVNTDPNSDDVSVLLGNGDGSFQAPMNFGAGGPGSVAVGDFNGDGKPDLLVAGQYSTYVSVLINNTP